MIWCIISAVEEFIRSTIDPTFNFNLNFPKTRFIIFNNRANGANNSYLFCDEYSQYNHDVSKETLKIYKKSPNRAQTKVKSIKCYLNEHCSLQRFKQRLPPSKWYSFAYCFYLFEWMVKACYYVVFDEMDVFAGQAMNF